MRNLHLVISSLLLAQGTVFAQQPAAPQQPAFPLQPAVPSQPADAQQPAVPQQPAVLGQAVNQPILPPPPNVLLPPPAALVPPGLPEPAARSAFIELTTLRLLLNRGLISPEEFASAMRDLNDSIGPRASDSATLVIGKWATTIYGFAQADMMYNSTQSFNDYAGNIQVARPGTPEGDAGRTTFSARDSRFGFRIQAPELSWMRASAQLEMDFLGPSGTIGETTTEAAFFNNPLLRLRHAYFKIETPIVDVLFGQTWQLFGWQPNFVPADVQWSGVVGSLFSRTIQLRISKTVKTKPVTLEFAISGARPPQRDSSVPEFEAGARISFNKWTGVHTLYMTSTSTMAASIGVSADMRYFTLPQFSATPMGTNSALGLGIAVDAYLPIIPGTKERKDNSLSIIGEFSSVQGANDMYVGLTGGVASPTLPGGATYTADVDAGQAVYDMNGNLRLPHWMNFIVGLEYYVPHVHGRIGLFANVARDQLVDSTQYANPTKVRDHEMFYNGGIFGDLSDAIRLGIDYAYFDDVYADGMHAGNHAVQMSGFFFF
jgi:hypothetical protein